MQKHSIWKTENHSQTLPPGMPLMEGYWEKLQTDKYNEVLEGNTDF